MVAGKQVDVVADGLIVGKRIAARPTPTGGWANCNAVPVGAGLPAMRPSATPPLQAITPMNSRANPRYSSARLYLATSSAGLSACSLASPRCARKVS